jgi:hypothetical protein
VILSDPQSIIKKIVISNSLDETLVGLETGLINCLSLRDIDLDHKLSMTEKGWKVMSNVLSSLVSNLKVLEVRGNFHNGAWIGGSALIDNKCTAALARGLMQNSTLECLCLKKVLFEQGGLLLLGDALSCPQSKINSLVLVTESPGVLLELQNGLVNNSSLRVLHFSANEDGDMAREEWQVVSNVLSSPVAALRVLQLEEYPFCDRDAIALASGLTHNTTLEEFHLSIKGRYRHNDWTAAGWLALISSLNNPNLQLKRIHIDDYFGPLAEINDETVFSLAEMLMSKSNTIEKVYFSPYWLITDAGWITLSASFLTPMPNLTEFCIRIETDNFRDHAVLEFMNGIHTKPLLRILDLGYAIIRGTAWEALSRALCDTSSLDAIQESSHTLVDFKGHPVDSQLPPEIVQLLKINKNCTPSQAVRFKFVLCGNGIKIESLANGQPEMQMKLVPFVMSWLGMHSVTHDALYQFIRNQPSLFDLVRNDASQELTAFDKSFIYGAKRKLEAME